MRGKEVAKALWYAIVPILDKYSLDIVLHNHDTENYIVAEIRCNEQGLTLSKITIS